MDIRDAGRGTARARRSSQRARVWLLMNSVVPPPFGASSTTGDWRTYRRAASAKLPSKQLLRVIFVVGTTRMPNNCSGPGAAGSLVM